MEKKADGESGTFDVGFETLRPVGYVPFATYSLWDIMERLYQIV
jgi:hypothetical protein